MAQVRKFDKGTNEGGVTVQPDLFEWEGVGNYERKPMVQTLTKNLAAYADHLGLSGDRRTRFLNNGAAAIKALESGQLRRLANGSYEDASGTISSTGKYDKNWLGKLKDTDNNAYNDIAGYFDAYMNKASVYDPEKAKKEAEEKAKKDKVKFGGDAYLKQALARALYAGNFSEDDWFNHRTDAQRNAAIADVFRNADYSSIYGKYLWDDTGIDSAEALRQRGMAFADAISNNNLEDLDYNTAAALGISNLKAFLERQEEAPATPDHQEQQVAAKKAFIDAKKVEGFTEEQAERLYTNEQNKAARARDAQVKASDDTESAAQLDAEWENWYSQHNRPDTSKLAAVVYGDTSKYSDDSILDTLQKNYNGNMAAFYDDAVRSILGEVRFNNSKTNQRYSDRDQQLIALRRLKHAAENNPSYFGQALPTGEFLLPETTRDDYVAYVYNPSNNSYRQVNLLANEAYKNFARGIWESRRSQSHKQGGVVKMQDGGYADYQRSLQEGREAANAWYQNAYNAREQQRKADKQAKSQPNPLSLRDYTRTKDQIAAGKRQVGSVNSDYEWTTADKIRLTTIGADVASTISALLPGYGTAASAVLGVGSTLGNLGADMMDDSVSGWQAAGNAVLGLGMDVVGLIPGAGAVGKAGKIAKTIKPISKGIIWTLRGIGTYQAIDSINAIQKLMTSPNEMTVDDWRSVAAGIQAVAGYTRYNRGKARVRDKYAQENVRHVTGSDGKKYTISEEQFQQLSQTKGFDSQNEAFRKAIKSRNPQATVPDDLKLQREFKGRDLKHINPANMTFRTQAPKNESETIYSLLPGESTPIRHWWQKFNNDNIYNTLWGSTRPTQATKQTSKQTPKRRIQSLGEGDTRTRQGNNVVRTGKLTDAEVKRINNNRKAAGKPALTKQEIDAINARAANNASTQAPTLQERLQQRRHSNENSVEAEVARARAELEAANRVAQRPVTAASAPRIVADQTVPARMELQDFINTSIPSRPVTGAARNARQSMYDNLFQAVPQARVIPARSVSPTVPNAPTARQHAARQQVLDRVFNAGPDPHTVIASNTKGSNVPVQQLVDSRLPKRPVSGAVRQKRQSDLEKVLGPVQKSDNRKMGAKKAKATKQAKKEAAAKKKYAEKVQSNSNKKAAAQSKSRFDNINKAAQKNKSELSKKPITKKSEVSKPAPKERIKKGSKAKRYNEKKFGGILEKFLNGGLIPKFQNSGVVKRNVTSTADWGNDIYGTKEFLDWFNSYNVDNFEDFNNLQRAWAANKKNTNYRPGASPLEYNQGVYDRQGKFNEAAGGVNALIEALAGSNGKIKRAGVSGDNADGGFQDGYFGEQEYLRHGGMEGMSQEKLLRLQALADARGLEYYIDPITKMGLLRKREEIVSKNPEPPRRVQEPTLDELVGPADRAGNSPKTTGKTTARAGEGQGGSGTDKPKTGWNLLPEDVMAASRMLMGLGANARAARQAKAGLRPLLTDTWENVVSPEWDYFAQRTGENQAARLASFAARPRTANSQDQFAGELEANTRGSQFIAQGNQQASNRFYATDRLRQQESDAAKARRVENANANMGRMLQVDAAKHQIDSALTTAQYAQVIAPWMAGIENQFRQNRAMQRQMDASAYQKARLAQMQPEYDKAVESGDQQAVQDITNKYYSDLFNYNKRAYSSPWLFQRTTELPETETGYSWIDYRSKGGRLTAREREVLQRAKDFNKRMLEDNKQFHKDIMESKREHNKLIAGMSNLTADLIRNGMKWK